jgi:hypothetical protein
MDKKVRIIGISVLLLAFCMVNDAKTNPQPEPSKSEGIFALPPVIIYKTRKNYAKNVAVGLSEDKKTIVYYPHPADVGVASMPVKLKKNFWLDNRGIGLNTAFLIITYEEYAKLSAPPSMAEMMQMIIDSDPILEMYALPANTDKNKDNLNKIISQKMKEAKKLK